MRLFQHVSFASSFISFCTVWASNCSFEPVIIPMKWVSLENQGQIRGGSIMAGSPPQNLSLLPVVEINNTFLFHQSSDCGVTKEACLTRRGGFFVPQDSKTYRNDTASSPINRVWEASETQTSGDVGIDTFTLNENTTLTDFSFGVAREQISVRLARGNGQSSFGLGRNSTLLSVLKNAGKIGSSSWGYWWGLDGATEPAKMNGNLVLGGFDKAKIRNPDRNYTGSFMNAGTCPQGMAITINEVRLNFPNGSEPNLLLSSPLQTCVCPQCPNVMSMRYDPYYARFETWTEAFSINRSLGINFFDMMYKAEEAYQGDLTLVLGNGLSIRIPNHQLAIPDRTIGGDGRINENTTVRDMMLYSLQGVNKDDMPRVGRVFFTGAYLWVNNDASTFTIWEANPTEDEDIVSVADAELVNACSASTTVGPSITSVHSPTTTNHSGLSGDSPKPAITGGTLGAIVVGSLVGIGVLGFMMYWVFAKQKAKSRKGDSSVAQQSADHTDITRHLVFEAPEHGPAEMRGSEPLSHEMWSGRHKYLDDVHELHSETRAVEHSGS